MSDVATTTERVEEILAAVPIFSHLSPHDLKKLAKLCIPKKFEAGHAMIQEGATGLGLFVITSGTVEVFKGEGDKRLILGAMEAGDVLGEIALIDSQPRTASAVAQTATECLLLTRDSFETLVKKDPEIAWCIVPSLAERVRELHARAVAAEERAQKHTAESAPAKPKAESKAEERTEAEAKSTEDDEDETSEAWETMARMMRMPYGMMVGGLTGMTTMAKMGETFFRKLADETDLQNNDDFSDVLEKAPDGFVAASREALSELEKMPQNMVDSFREIYKED